MLKRINKKVLMTESDIRDILIEELGYETCLMLELKGFSLGSIAKGIGSALGTAKKFWKKKAKQVLDVINPVKVTKYPVQNVRAVEAAMDKHGITNKFMRIAILSVIAKESGMVPKNEKGYQGTSNSRIRHIFGKRVSNMADSAISALKSNAQAFFDKMYGGKYGNK